MLVKAFFGLHKVNTLVSVLLKRPKDSTTLSTGPVTCVATFLETELALLCLNIKLVHYSLLAVEYSCSLLHLVTHLW